MVNNFASDNIRSYTGGMKDDFDSYDNVVRQNNGPMQVFHVHFHITLNPRPEQGLKVGWPMQKVEQSDLTATLDRIKKKL
ncbi:hypothetical protein BCR43DRAFT_518939 [Syncephalastrum racemosum]|uniref:HIT domain-containing protein n=1 Tax=Syncephalastrum racemosum TaxID=13706 RepID=A0A1X2H071_SYNRA|nr:hypothetical protein BCR43DRAFT_518939 [Syncephalastrum racemosum]